MADEKVDPEQILAEATMLEDEEPFSEEDIDISFYPWADEDEFYEKPRMRDEASE